MSSYYASRLAGERLGRCYALASPRVKRYLEAEIRHVLGFVGAGLRVLELGCGYGRALQPIAERARIAVGIDTAWESLGAARRLLAGLPRCHLCLMDAARLGFAAGSFDLVACVQNGISAFQCDRATLVAEAVRVTRPGGVVLVSSYAPRFWPDRLEWFRAQAAEGLIGPLDPEATREGTIVCRDGFRSSSVGADELLALALPLPVSARVIEVDGSSLFCEMRVRADAER